MLLKDRVTVVYGACGSVGGAIARAFAAEGAALHLAGKHHDRLALLAAELRGRGNTVYTGVVDATDGHEVNAYLQRVVNLSGRIDISFNLIGWQDVQDVALADMDVEDFLRPIRIAMQSQFLTAAAAARSMRRQGSGVILFLTATPAGKAYAGVGGFGPACSAVEAFSRNLAAELGPSGIRVITLRSAGSPDSAVFRNAIAAGGSEIQAALDRIVNDTMLKRMPLLSEIADAAVFAASDRASAITGSTLNLTCGTTRD
ncbi:short-chain dehydrogenase [Pedobacter yulinensis]|uniref:Short-chain dehydrogenase n=1 Tax=Pedobacter yulinensis TaxID=2126353 RepID=A0A2T3HRD5_9SPHI|nr:SDR family oxidoreductase [Pedobacter yulinensis]PST84989.1 short-chain dehydrogenase [Pedobacter yulinensis]